MKIAVWHHLPSGGAKRALFYHVRGLVERGHTVESWCPETAEASYLPLSTLVPEHIRPLRWQRSAPRSRIGALVASYRNVIGQVEAMAEHCRACADEMRSKDFDVLFANGSRFLATSPMGRHVDFPKVLYLNEPYRFLHEARPRLPWIALPPSQGSPWRPRNIWRTVNDLVRVQGLRVQYREEVLNAAGFDALLVNSLFSRENVLRIYGIDAKVCYLGVDCEVFVDRNQERESFLVGVGAFVPGKNIELALAAVGRIPRPRPPLVWIGNAAQDAYLGRLRYRAEELDVDFRPRVRIRDGELVEVLNRASVFVATPRLEPFGLAPLEANACGLPVVAVSEGGLRETIFDGVNGLLVPPAVTELTAGIRQLIERPDVARQLGRRARRYVQERWNLPAAIERLEAHFAEVIARRNERHSGIGTGV